MSFLCAKFAQNELFAQVYVQTVHKQDLEKWEIIGLQFWHDIC